MIPLAVFGDPIEHSLSPRIHQLFAQQSGVEVDYRRILAPEASFAQQLADFFAKGGQGANITLPHKVRVLELMDKVSARAAIAGAANTLFLKDGVVVCDNTDGEGLVRDLTRLRGPLNGSHVLIMGAGGATRGVIQPLLEAGVSKLSIGNRTLAKAQQLVTDFDKKALQLATPEQSMRPDILINATASGHSGLAPVLPADWFTGHPFCYDLSYGKAAEPFHQLAAEKSCEMTDGLGMLVAQGAASFTIWTQVEVDFVAALTSLQGDL
ncbi:shikimate dehydrogenase [Aliidiomarina minuta]|uniref:Shikimate dehydrogenase (NADP(+)) n=1 Tax=Aliidiomarina minuta TaxID=880057 RepID=A0A432WA15_9GAMM|nr:shikimate dehydrogenase [Aliidiomarina minuta]RUO26954.1 shikimate dehydrogenase [Aliidiomarina minuta]